MVTVPAGWLISRDCWKRWWLSFMMRWERHIDPHASERDARLTAAKDHQTMCEHWLDKWFP